MATTMRRKATMNVIRNSRSIMARRAMNVEPHVDEAGEEVHDGEAMVLDVHVALMASVRVVDDLDDRDRIERRADRKGMRVASRRSRDVRRRLRPNAVVVTRRRNRALASSRVRRWRNVRLSRTDRAAMGRQKWQRRSENDGGWRAACAMRGGMQTAEER